jgi:phenylpropionate dioxygenase-like ring-hydroxylating dioxygenase large terminal subunit
MTSVPYLSAARAVERPPFTTDRYVSPEFLELEKTHVFRKGWLVVGRESDLPRPGDRIPVEELGESLVLVRGNDGVVRAFLNTCRHRGTRLVTKKCTAPRITCPYHGWTYGLDGRLLGVPKASGFDGFDKDTRPLFAVRSESWGGFVWVTFDDDAPPLSQYLGALERQLTPYRLEEMRPLMRRTWELPCNWKAVLDQATESYHLRAVHGQSVGRVIDTVSTFYELDLHHLQTIPIADFRWRPWLDRMSIPRDLECSAEQLRLFHKYIIFPNTLINVMPYHLTVFRVFPVTPDTCRFHYEFHVRERAGVVARLRGWLTLLASLYILREDFSVLLPFQAGLKAGGSRPIVFHREERPLEYFHGVIDRRIEESAATPLGGP